MRGPDGQRTGQVDEVIAAGIEALQRRGLQATGVSITISDPTRAGNPLLWVNPAFTATTGHAFEEAVGRNYPPASLGSSRLSALVSALDSSIRGQQ